MVAPYLNPEVTVGSLLTVASVLFGLWAASVRVSARVARQLTEFKAVLEVHANTLVEHSRKMEKQDDILLRLVGEMQRIIGRLEVNAEQVRQQHRSP